ncbi:unknown function [Klebsiella phage vB_Kpl_K59PH2]|uniref:Uncharacterized protein n=1 Tax=Klebsiella phage vB_Kpl_K59PH2 TaxID=3071671 RepID=A0AAD2JTE6_9CAUD|nr:unknown function [Klebsiella phage vB_Kpl_K59PH2]
MSKQNILTFLREWLQYSNACMKAHKAGAFLPHSHPFTPYDGLCGNLDKWCDARTTNLSYDDSLEFRRGMGSVLRDLFRADRLCTCWTFGERSFRMRFDNESNCRCPNRRRWVKKTIAKLEQELSDGNN